MMSSCQDTVGASGGDPTLAAWLGQLQEASFGQAGPAVRKAYPPTRRLAGSQLARYLGRDLRACLHQPARRARARRTDPIHPLRQRLLAAHDRRRSPPGKRPSPPVARALHH